MSVSQKKLLVAGLGLTNNDLAQLKLSRGVVKVVKHFKYAFVFGINGALDTSLKCTRLKF